jgi:hypothetical protein
MDMISFRCCQIFSFVILGLAAAQCEQREEEELHGGGQPALSCDILWARSEEDCLDGHCRVRNRLQRVIGNPGNSRDYAVARKLASTSLTMTSAKLHRHDRGSLAPLGITPEKKTGWISPARFDY